MSDAKVSVVVPVFNRANFLTACVHSILDTQYPNLEILLVDDGSSDGSDVAIASIRRAHPDVVRHLWHEGRQNLGVSASRNLAIKASTGDYICFLDSDDLMLPHRFGFAIPLLVSSPEVDGVFEQVEIVAGDHVVQLIEYFAQDLSTKPANAQNLLLMGMIPSCGITVRRGVFDICGYFDERKWVGEDIEMWLRMIVLCRLVAGESGVAVAQVIKHSGNTSGYRVGEVELRVIRDVLIWAGARGCSTSVLEALEAKYFELLYYYVNVHQSQPVAAGEALQLLGKTVLRFPKVLGRKRFWGNVVQSIDRGLVGPRK